MSTVESADEVCACCGKAEVDDTKLKKCACLLVRYCSVDCQKNHRPQHKKACRKRLAEKRDDLLLTQPEESDLGECPICCLPLPLDDSKFAMYSCCCKYICKGCIYGNEMRELRESLEHKCPFCREPVPNSKKEAEKMITERVTTSDPFALFQMGDRYHDEGDYEKASEYLAKAAGFGEAGAHFELSLMYDEGEGVERDEKNRIYHLEEAAIGGHPLARFNLGCIEYEAGKFDRAGRHWIIAAKLGQNGALKAVKGGFAAGFVSKEDYAAALRGHQAAVDATKSQQREEAEKYYELLRNAPTYSKFLESKRGG